MDTRLHEKAAGKAAAPMDEAEKLAVLALWCIVGIGAATLRAVRAAFGSFAEAIAAPRELLFRHIRAPEAQRQIAELGEILPLAEEAISACSRCGARIVFPGDSLWPERIESVEDYPLLFVRGSLSPVPDRHLILPGRPALAVVGARNTDIYGQKLAAFWTSEMARRGVGIISGGALGIDAEAHHSALKAGGWTLAVLGTGIDVSYPPENRKLFEDILRSGGGLVSQFPPGASPAPRNFVMRNALIAALSDAVLVPRASTTSGALSTARAAREIGRPAFVLPGDLTNPLSLGAQVLTEEGTAVGLFCLGPLGDLLGVPGPWPTFAEHASGVSIEPPPPRRAAYRRKKSAQLSLGPPLAASDGRESSASGTSPSASGTSGAQGTQLSGGESDSRTVTPDELPPELLRTLNSLDKSPRCFDELTEETRLDAAALADALLRLELMGRIEELPGRLYRRL